MMIQILANGLWQGALVVALAFAMTRFLARESAATRYGIWFTALLVLALVPVLSAVWPLHLPSFDDAFRAGQSARIRMTLVAAGTIADGATPYVRAGLMLWLTGSALAFVRLAASALSIARIRRAARPLSGYDDVLVSDTLSAPIAAGLRFPVVIVPATIIERFSPHDVSLVIAHERAHIARHDIAGNFVQRAIEAALVLNPWIYVVSHNLIKEREAACDDAAAVTAGAIDEYVTCLAAIARAVTRPRAPLVSPSVFGSRKMLVSRIERLVNHAGLRKPHVNWYAVGTSIGVFTLIALLLQSIGPVVAAPGTVVNNGHPMLAAACAQPNTDAQVLYATAPDVPENAHPKRPVLLRVTIEADGTVPRVGIIQSSGDWSANEAAIEAATHSKYTPATRNCRAVQGTYIFRVEFMPR
jgi:TonB family protein